VQYCELTDYDMPAGSVTIWRPLAHPDSVTPDDRPLAPQHERHVTVHEPGQRSDWIGATFEVHAAYEPAAMRSALWLWHKRHETLRSTVRHEESAWRRLLITADALDVEPQDVGSFASGAEVADRIQGIFQHSISPHEWPHLLTATVVPRQMAFEPPRFQVVFGADHAVMDAYSLLLAVTELQQLYAHAVYGTEPTAEAVEMGSYVDFSALERSLSLRHRGGDTLRRWREFLGVGEPQFPPFPLGAPNGGGEPGRQRTLYGPLLSAEETRRVQTAARARRHKMQTAVFCALAEAARRTTSSSTLKFVMPMHTRTAAYERSIGWFVGLSPVTIPLDIDPAFDGDRYGILLARCAQALRHARDDAAIPFPVIEDRLGVRSNPRFVVSFVDLRFVPGADRFDAVRACALRRPVAASDEVHLWISRALSGLNVSARLSGDAGALAAFEGFLAETREVLLELTAAPDSRVVAAGASDGLAGQCA
jgi:hypothetical protein